MPEFLVISSGELCLFFFFAWLFRITSGSGCETCTTPKTHALKITHAWQDHVHFPEFEFVKIWRNLSAAKRETPLLNVLQPPQKRHYNDWSFLVSLSLKKKMFIYFSHWSANPDRFNIYMYLFVQQKKQNYILFIRCFVLWFL